MALQINRLYWLTTHRRVQGMLRKDLGDEAKAQSKNWIVSQALELYKSIYRVETIIKDMPLEQKLSERSGREAVTFRFGSIYN